MTAPSKPTAKTFQDPLLRVLGSLTDYTAGVSVKYTDTYMPTMGLLDITSLDQYGVNDKTNTPWVAKWIQWAFRNLRKQGMTELAGRGKWALTAKGVNAAEQLPTGDGWAPARATAKPITPATQVVPVSVNVGPGNDETAYHPDDYIRVLAVQSSTCYGGFTDRSPLCADCPIQGGCRNFMAAQLSKLAGTLAEQDAQAVTKAQTPPKADPKSKAQDDTPKAQDDADGPLAGSARKLSPEEIRDLGIEEINMMVVEGECARCGQPIDKGSPALWQPATDTDPGGLFHHACLRIRWMKV